VNLEDCTPNQYSENDLVDGNKCHLCGTPCLECNSSSSCKSCVTGFYIEKTPLEIESGFYTQTALSVECIPCPATDSLLIVDDIYCTECHSSCKTCSGTTRYDCL